MKPVYFAGVDGVRVVKRGRKFQVQTQWNDDGERIAWTDIGEPFDTQDEALDEAPYLCEF
jgi:hypothetical protein